MSVLNTEAVAETSPSFMGTPLTPSFQRMPTTLSAAFLDSQDQFPQTGPSLVTH